MLDLKECKNKYEALRKYGFKTLKKELEILYLKKEFSIDEIAQKTNSYHSTIYSSLKMVDIPIRSVSERALLQVKHSKTPFGYVSRGFGRRMALPKIGDQRKKGSADKNRRTVQIYLGSHQWKPQYILIMAAIVGRKIKKGEIVHHRDGNHNNNYPWNLSLCLDHRMSEEERTDLENTPIGNHPPGYQTWCLQLLEKTNQVLLSIQWCLYNKIETKTDAEKLSRIEREIRLFFLTHLPIQPNIQGSELFKYKGNAYDSIINDFTKIGVEIYRQDKKNI